MDREMLLTLIAELAGAMGWSDVEVDGEVYASTCNVNLMVVIHDTSEVVVSVSNADDDMHCWSGELRNVLIRFKGFITPEQAHDLLFDVKHKPHFALGE